MHQPNDVEWNLRKLALELPEPDGRPKKQGPWAVRRLARAALGAWILAPHASSDPMPIQQGCFTERVSVGPNGEQSPQPCFSNLGCVSADGRWVGFSADANLVPEDTGNHTDAYVRDRLLGTTFLISVAMDGSSGNAFSGAAYLSSDASCVAFFSLASDMVAGDTNNLTDLFVRDLKAKTTTRVSVASDGSQANGETTEASLSADGRWVAFMNGATNLVPGDTNGTYDVFVHDRVTGETTRVSLDHEGNESTRGGGLYSISADGRYVAFSCYGVLDPLDINQYVDTYVHDRWTSKSKLAALTYTGVGSASGTSSGQLSGNGRYLAFSTSGTDVVPGDTNGKSDIFVRELVLGTTVRANVSSSGAQANNNCFDPAISADGRYVGFTTLATNLVSPPTNGAGHVFVKDLLTGAVSLKSVSSTGVPNNNFSQRVVLSADGSVTVWTSATDVLVPGDTNDAYDVFARECRVTKPTSWCLAQANSLGCPATVVFHGEPSVSAGSGFAIGAKNILNQTPGLLFYGTSGADLKPFQGGWLCIAAPLLRTIVVSSGGSSSPSADCTGVLSFDFNAWIASGVDPALAQGTEVHAQFWSRDPGLPPPSVVLSNALNFQIAP